MRLLEGETHDPEAWSLALLDGEVAGVILANRFPLDDEGTFTFIGVAKGFRGRGLGRGTDFAQEPVELIGIGADALIEAPLQIGPLLLHVQQRGLAT